MKLPKFITNLFVDEKLKAKIKYEVNYDTSIHMLKYLNLYKYVDTIIKSPQVIIRGRVYIACTYLLTDSVILDAIKHASFVAVLVSEISSVGVDNRIRVIILNRNEQGEYVEYTKPPLQQFGQYIVDISKSPLDPPVIDMTTIFFTQTELQNIKDWTAYCTAYGDELKKKAICHI